MPGTDGENVYPSRANLVAVKGRIISARKGLNMLKHKRDALDIKVRQLKSQSESMDIQMTEALTQGLLHLARARFHGTKFQPYMVAQTSKAETYLLNHTARVVGINIPTFHFKTEPTNKYRFTGLSGGGQETQLARLKFLELLQLLISIASIQFSLFVLEPALQQTQTRCNAVQYVIIPKMERTKNYILDALDEQEREDFYRLKCSKAKQIKHKNEDARRLGLEVQPSARVKQFGGEKAVVQGDSSKQRPPLPVLDDRHRIRWKTRDNTDKTTDTKEDKRVPDKCMAMSKNWKNLQTDE